MGVGAPASVRRAVPAGQSASVFTVPAFSTISIEPGAGGTMTCQVRVHPDSPLIDLDPATPSFSANATRAIMGPVAEVRFTAVTAAGSGSVAY